MPQLIVDLNIPKDEWLRIYQGHARLVYATARDGRSIQFPANILSRYTTHTGIYGTFSISFSNEGKFQSIHQI